MNKKAVAQALQKHLALNQDSKVVVIGLGETGFSVAKFFLQHSISFAVIDSRNKPPFNDVLLRDYPDVPVFTGGFNKEALDIATHLVVSPGISLQEQSIQKALCRKIRLMSDIDLFACATDKSIIAVTGSNGKSTVTTMLGAMGNRSEIKTAIGGNLGVPALDLLNESIELYVIELSSFQLERAECLNAKAACVLNISSDHLDRHHDISEYAKEKQRIYSGNGVMVINEDDPRVKMMADVSRESLLFSVVKKTDFHIELYQGKEWLMNSDQPLMQKSEFPMEGLHNASNALAALALGTAVGMDTNAMCEALREYRGLEHRMQKVAEVKGVTWVNDSKATNIGACVAALHGYKKKVVLIAGGDAKNADMNELAPTICKKARCAVLLGKDAGIIDKAINGKIPTYRVKTIQEAVQMAAKLAKEGEHVLLSPACASIDQFDNYRERGNEFTSAVMGVAV